MRLTTEILDAMEAQVYVHAVTRFQDTKGIIA